MKQHPYWKPKFIAAGGTILISTGLLLLSKLTGDQWVTVVLGSLMIFSGSSVMENRALTQANIDPRWMPDTERRE